MSEFLLQLRERAAAQPRRIAFPESTDQRTLQAVAQLERENLVEPVVVGPPRSHARFDEFVDALVLRRTHKGLTREQAEAALEDPLFFAASMLAAGAVDGCVGGASRPTADVMRAALWCVGPTPGIRTISSSFYMIVKPFRGNANEVLTFTDAGVVPDPTVVELADIAQAAADARRQVVGDEPRVAFLSYSTHGSADGPSVTRVREALQLFHMRCPDVEVEGELQADAALIQEVAVRKYPASRLAGRANVLVFPDLNSGNIAYKLVQWLGGAVALGPILQGLARPYNDLSRGASVTDIVNVACITALQAGSA